MVGYSEDPLLFSLVNMVDRFPVWFEGENTVGNVLQAQSIMGIRTFVERFVSATASISYNYDARYVFLFQHEKRWSEYPRRKNKRPVESFLVCWRKLDHQ